MMKKIALLIAAVAFMATANAQLVVGLQGGYYQKNFNNNTNVDATTNVNWLGGAQIGYMVTQRLYVGVAGNYNSFTDDTMLTHMNIIFENMPRTVDNYRHFWSQTGWSVSPQVKYEFLRYGNMHFHVLLSGTVTKMGYRTLVESFNTPFRNNGEFVERPAMEDQTGTFTWGVNLRPTITYEFSQHLAAELSLDFLSVGYAKQTVTYDGPARTAADGSAIPDVYTTSTLYAGLNTLMETLRWESPMLRLGFNWTF